MTMDLTSPAVQAALTAAIGEALKTWGSYALVLIVLGVMHWRSMKREALKDEEITLLRAEIKLLQEKRLEDARQLIRVTETGTATMAARTDADQQFRTLITQLVEKISDIEDFVRPPPAPRTPQRRSSR